MINKDTLYIVKNRSSSVVIYSLPELNIRREFAPGESKRISFGELESLTYQQGGRELIENFLQIEEIEVTDNLNIAREPEYNMSEQQVINLLKNSTLDEFLDALDFAPMGVLDLIELYAVRLPLTDMDKREALKEKRGFDVDRAIANDKLDKQGEKTAEAPKRRTEPVKAEGESAAPARRTSGNSYKVTNRAE